MNRAAPRWLIWLGVPAVSLAGALAARLVWEQTIWTWEHGPEMVGYALTHTWLGLLLLSAAPVSLAWVIVALGFVIQTRRIADRSLLALLIVCCIAWGLMLVPYGSWERLFIARFSHAQAIALLMDAAGEGDVRTVRAVLESGIPVNAQGPAGTALHVAAAHGQLDTMACLMRRITVGIRPARAHTRSRGAASVGGSWGETHHLSARSAPGTRRRWLRRPGRMTPAAARAR